MPPDICFNNENAMYYFPQKDFRDSENKCTILKMCIF